MKKLQILVAIVGIFHVQNLMAQDKEVDQFTQLTEHSKLSDSSILLNAKVNQLFDDALIAANKEGRCDGKTPEESGKARTALYEALGKKLAQTYWGNPMVDFIEGENTIPKVKTPLEKSIYSAKEMSSYKTKLAPVVQFQNTRIGTDKLNEFFAAGYSRFKELRFNKTESGRLKRAERTSIAMEEAGSSPVLSWADHAARMSGYKFWNQICGAPDEDKSAPDKEYFAKNGCHTDRFVTCESGKWQRNPKYDKIDLAQFIDDKWDESVNCSQYRDEVLEEVVEQMKLANANASKSILPPCPVDQKKCVAIVAGKDSDYVSPVCENVATAVSAKKPTSLDLSRFLNKGRHHSTFESDRTRRPKVHGVVTGS